MDQPRTSRRQLLGLGAAAGGALLLRRPLPVQAWTAVPTAPRIAVVGAGLAGLSCAYRLTQAGLPVTVFEANPNRLGGRCWTARGFAGGQTAEHGGEFIDTSQHAIRRLVAELGLELEDGRRPVHARGRSRYWFGGKERSGGEVYKGWGRMVSRARRDAKRIGPYLHRAQGKAAAELDEMTAREWIDEVVPGPEHAVLRGAMKQYMAEEYGLEAAQLSALNMVIELGPRGRGSDERFHVRGGNDLIVTQLAAAIPASSIERGMRLSSLRRRGDGSYALGFEGVPGARNFDFVALCLPFTTLRRAAIERAGIGKRRRRAIEELGMGTNAKVLIQLERRVQLYDNWNGEYYDRRVDTWDSTATQRGRHSVLTVFSGGEVGRDYRSPHAHGKAPSRSADNELNRIGRAVGGVEHARHGPAWIDHWAADPYTHGSYAAFKPGQITRFWGRLARPVHNLHFGGEHTETSNQGYLDGAVHSGERCAREIGAKAR